MKDLMDHIEDVAREGGIYHLVTTNRTLLKVVERALDRYMAEVLREFVKCARVSGEQINVNIELVKHDDQT